MASRGKIKKLLREQREAEENELKESMYNALDDYMNSEMGKIFSSGSENNYTSTNNYVDNSNLCDNKEFKRLLENRSPLFGYEIIKINKCYIPNFYKGNKRKYKSKSLKLAKINCAKKFKLVPNKVIVNHVHKVIYAPANIYDKIKNYF